MPSAAAMFDAYARDYDVPRRRLVPNFDGFYCTVADVLGFCVVALDADSSGPMPRL